MGKLFKSPWPQRKHSALQLDLSTLINTTVRAKKIARAFPELRCTFGGSSIVPDIAVFTWEHIPVDENGEIANVFSLAPDWTIEILSPGQSVAKVTGKILRCLEHGTQMEWLIEPAHKSVVIYHSQQNTQVVETEENLQSMLAVSSFMTELTITAEDLFSLLLL